jgi:hypothetical protein
MIAQLAHFRYSAQRYLQSNTRRMRQAGLDQSTYARICACADLPVALFVFGLAGNCLVDALAAYALSAAPWVLLLLAGLRRLLCALFTLFGHERVIETPDGLVRERILFGVGVQTALE